LVIEALYFFFVFPSVTRTVFGEDLPGFALNQSPPPKPNNPKESTSGLKFFPPLRSLRALCPFLCTLLRSARFPLCYNSGDSSRNRACRQARTYFLFWIFFVFALPDPEPTARPHKSQSPQLPSSERGQSGFRVRSLHRLFFSIP